MKFDDQNLLDELAVDYILGTMRGAARRRFQKLMMSQPNIRQTVWRWEQHLNPLAESLPTSAPNPEVWLKIQRRLGWLPTEQRVETRTTSRVSWLIAAAASILLAVVMLRPYLVDPVSQQVALIQTTDAKVWWSIAKTELQLTVRATSAVQAHTDKDYELWMLPANGQAPISLGLLPQNQERILQVPAAAKDLMIAALAVSIEPKGGSPTGAPTGDVLFTAEIITL
ncbi:hypothetical protein AGRI_12521 [Alishewanella agri BL06]|uniref:Anti-sigma K factor RskA C-terminal domain-containing protein n=1 Tax=Alishewanella agri BL06 TaxID=1195246 RepID=I8U7Q8_9ALTE|nr:anti-sigma factor [Alishewanella agri]EIW88028.1 hypothetical protein AGRI_12521 [Alishewanella agri BL06]